MTPLSFCCLAALEIGLTGGVPVTDFVKNYSFGHRYGGVEVESAPRRYTLGPTVGIRLFRPLSVETGFLYKRFGLDTATASDPGFHGLTQTRSSTRGNAWEIPVIARLPFHLRAGTHLIVGAGVNLRILSGVSERGVRTEQPSGGPDAFRTVITNFTTNIPDRRLMAGAAVQAGVAFPAGPLRLTPLVRVTRWDSERAARLPHPVRFERWQADVLLTLSRRPTSAGGVESVQFPARLEPGVLVGSALGVFLDWRFSEMVSLEAGFFTHRFHGRSEQPNPPTVFVTQLEGRAWTLPLLVRIKPLPGRRFTPAFGAGPAFRKVANSSYQAGAPGQLFSGDSRFLNIESVGLAVSAGAELRFGQTRWRPELRWTRFSQRLYELGEQLEGPRHVVQVVVGIGWARRAP